MKKPKQHRLLALALAVALCAVSCGGEGVNPASPASGTSATFAATGGMVSNRTTTASLASRTSLTSTTTVTRTNGATTTCTENLTTGTTQSESHKSNVTSSTVVGGDLLGKDKQRLKLETNGEEVTLSFSQAVTLPSYDDAVLWVYEGVTPSGAAVTCKVAAATETIHSITQHVSAQGGFVKEEDVRSFVLEELHKRGFVLLKSSLDVHVMASGTQVRGSFGRVRVNLSPQEYMDCVVREYNGRLYLANISAWTKKDSDIVPACGTEYPYLQPHWM